MGAVPPKFFLPSAPYGSSQATTALSPVAPAAQNPQTPLLPPNFTDPGTMSQQTQQNPMNQSLQSARPQGRNPLYGMFGRGLFALLLLLPSSLWATTTVTGKIQNLGTGNITSGAFVRFWLRGCAGNQPRINGTSVIGPTQGGVFFFDFAADGSGNVSGTLYSTRDAAGTGNGDIECGGSKTAVWYGMQIWVAGKAGPEVAVHAKNTSSLDITQVTPITTNPVVASPTGDGTYLRIDAGNSPETGNVAFTGNNTACQLNSVLYVGGSITCWAGADIGAQINSAYAALPSSGGRIHVLSQASCYAATTAISFATVGKPVLLEGDPGGPACISYAAASTSIVAITLDYLSGPPQAAAGVRDIKFIGPGTATTSVGIKLGVANGAPYSTLSGLTFGSNGGATDGFGTDISFNFNSFGGLIEKSQIQNATTGLSVSSGSESLRIDASSISHNTTGLSCNNGSDVYIWGHSIDDNSTGVSISGGCRVEFHGVHFENVSVSAASAAYGVCTGGELLFYGGQMQDDQVSGTTAQFIQANSGNCNIGIFGTLVHTLGRTLTQIVNFNGAGSGRGWLMPFYFSANVLSDFNQAYTAGPVFDLPMGTGSGPNNTAGFFGTTLQFKNSSGFISGPGANPYNLAINNPATSRTLSISDPGAAAAFVFDVATQTLQAKTFNASASPGTAVAFTAAAGNPYNLSITNPGSPRTLSFSDTLMTLWGGIVPGSAGGFDAGSTSLPFGNLWLGTAATNNFKFQPAATAAARTVSIPDPLTNVNLAFNLSATSAAFATATTAATCVQNTTAVTGATTAMVAEASPVSTPGVGAVWSAFVSSAGNVTITECAVAASAGGTIAFNIRVHP